MYDIYKKLSRFIASARTGKRWAAKTLVVGPTQPVDGDSVACTKALIDHLRKLGLEAFTLPTTTMFKQLAWILTREDYHPASLDVADAAYTTSDLQAAYDAVLKTWKPDEIVLVDGPANRLGFNPRGVFVYNIDHHIVDSARNDQFAFVQEAPSAGCLLIEQYRVHEPILAVSILTDTYWLRQSFPARAAHCLSVLVDHGLGDAALTDMQKKLFVPKGSAIVAALHASRLTINGNTAFAVLKEENPEIHRGVMQELGYFCRHVCVVRKDGYASFRTSDEKLDLRPLATRWGGGGHASAAAGHLESVAPETTNLVYEDFIRTVKPGL